MGIMGNVVNDLAGKADTDGQHLTIGAQMSEGPIIISTAISKPETMSIGLQKWHKNNVRFNPWGIWQRCRNIHETGLKPITIAPLTEYQGSAGRHDNGQGNGVAISTQPGQ